MKQYEAPKLERIGTFEEVTQQVSCGATLDDTFPAGTPVNQITCTLS